MISNEDRERIERLPTWARNLIKRLETFNEPAIEEAAKCRKEAAQAKELAQRYSESNEALMELLRSAGRLSANPTNLWAAEVIKVLEGYEIFQSGKTE